LDDFWTPRGLRVEVRIDSAVSLASMADAGDFYGGLVPVVEEDAIIATAETKAGFRRLELFHIASAVGQVTVNAMENLNCGLPIDGPQIGTGLW
jgi:hypothetical protein